MSKETNIVAKKSFKKSWFILMLLFLIISVTFCFKEQIIAKLAANNFTASKHRAFSEQSIASSAAYNSDDLVKEEANSVSVNYPIEQKQQITEPALVVAAPKQNGFESNNHQLNYPKNNNYTLNYQSSAYLNYLKNVNHIIINLFLDEPYTSYLNELNIGNLPANFALLIENLKQYNKHYLVAPPVYRQRIFPLHWPIIQKFIRIDKNSAEISLKAIKKAEIINKLNFWLDYCYAEDFRTKFNQPKD